LDDNWYRLSEGNKQKSVAEAWGWHHIDRVGDRILGYHERLIPESTHHYMEIPSFRNADTMLRLIKETIKRNASVWIMGSTVRIRLENSRAFDVDINNYDGYDEAFAHVFVLAFGEK